MRRIFTLIIVTLIISQSSAAQLWSLRNLEVTIAPGTTHSFTDIGRYLDESNYLGFRDLSAVNTGLALSGNARYRLTRDLAVRGNLLYGYLHASDIHGSEKPRNFEASVEIFEPSLIAEFYIIKNKRENALLFIKSKREGRHPLMAYFDLYIFGGIGGVFRDVSPNPSFAMFITHTDIKGFSPVIPAGIGVSRNYSDTFKAGIELGGRYLLEDDMESLMTAGSGNDSYYFLSVNFTWRFKTTRYPAF